MSKIAGTYLLETLKSFRGLKSTAEKAFAQIRDDDFHVIPEAESNSVAVVMKHMAGNMLSRFTDFLTSDGEKPGRNRDGEFTDDFSSHAELLSYWNSGWETLLQTMSELDEEDLLKIVTIRQEPHTVLRALQRQLVHYAYHTGQIVYLCKMIKASEFRSLSIPKGKSDDYLTSPPPSGNG